MASGDRSPCARRRRCDRARRRRPGRRDVRAIVGISGNATHPDALRELNGIPGGDLRIVPKGDRLFHPKPYLFELRAGGIAERRAWIGSANFTRAGFGGQSAANEEVVLEVGPGERADALADWFQERWDRFRIDSPVLKEIRREGLESEPAPSTGPTGDIRGGVPPERSLGR